MQRRAVQPGKRHRARVLRKAAAAARLQQHSLARQPDQVLLVHLGWGGRRAHKPAGSVHTVPANTRERAGPGPREGWPRSALSLGGGAGAHASSTQALGLAPAHDKAGLSC